MLLRRVQLVRERLILGASVRKDLCRADQRISEKEKAVRDLEAQMASPGFYEDRTRAEEAAEVHKKLMWEVGDLLSQWEALQTEVEVRG